MHKIIVLNYQKVNSPPINFLNPQESWRSGIEMKTLLLSTPLKPQESWNHKPLLTQPFGSHSYVSFSSAQGEINLDIVQKVLVKNISEFDVCIPTRNYHFSDFMGQAEKWADHICARCTATKVMK